DIEAFLQQLHAEYQHSVAQRFTRPFVWPERTLYIDPQIQLRSDKSIHSLDKFLTDWLASEDGARQFLVILGEFGTGKTQFSYRACELIEKHCRHRAPVMIKLGEFRDGADPAAIAAACPDRQHFHDANRDGALVLILDAFDEMGKADPRQTLDESFSRLTEGLIEGNAKLIVTCRKEFFRSDDEVDRFEFGAKASGKIIAASAEKVEIQLFDQPRIGRALDARKRGSVLKEIENHRGLMDLARRPVLLDLIAQYDRPFDASTKKADLYEDYIRNELRRGPDDKRANQRRKFAEEIAWRIQNEGPLPAAEVETSLKSMGFLDEADRFRSRSLLVREVSDYVFGHASFREYLVAKQVIPYLRRGEPKACKLSDPTIEFIREMWTWTPPPQPIERDGMIQIPAGPFIFGEANSARVANIEKPFWIDKYPVTNQQYLDFLH
ncbi:MAG TPA: SUMF1/EgtB/PvdO family nonheme iron enzyme, partial [Bryobacteraceae bacterium]